MQSTEIRRALISVSDKAGIFELCLKLDSLGVHMLSTGGTFKLLKEKGIKVQEVADYTGFPEMMDGRVKTLHPRIHGGLLGRRGEVEGVSDTQVMEAMGIVPIDLLVVNLYPFEQVIAEPGCTFADAIENIDIGGPAMVRSAAKNHSSVAVVVDPEDYVLVMDELDRQDGRLSGQTRFALASKAFARIAEYDAAIANYLGRQDKDGSRMHLFPETLTLHLVKSSEMRYGENPHQQAAFYVERNAGDSCVARARLLQGKALSFNNVADTDAAFECVKNFAEPACVIVKHANPCGVAVATSLAESYKLAFETDPTSAFGGVIAFNRELDAELARKIVESQFVEVLIAPSIGEAARKVVAAKKNVRLLEAALPSGSELPDFDFKRVRGGLLVQERDTGRVSRESLEVVTKRTPTEQEFDDMLFAWIVAKYVKSNAIVYAKDQRTIGIGAGQMSRVYSARIAGIKAADEHLEVPGSVMASDAFFPFRDSIDAAANAGITAVIQPGGSIRDGEVIEAADEAGMAMVFTGMRHFRH